MAANTPVRWDDDVDDIEGPAVAGPAGPSVTQRSTLSPLVVKHTEDGQDIVYSHVFDNTTIEGMRRELNNKTLMLAKAVVEEDIIGSLLELIDSIHARAWEVKKEHDANVRAGKSVSFVPDPYESKNQEHLRRHLTGMVMKMINQLLITPDVIDGLTANQRLAPLEFIDQMRDSVTGNVPPFIGTVILKPLGSAYMPFTDEEGDADSDDELEAVQTRARTMHEFFVPRPSDDGMDRYEIDSVLDILRSNLARVLPETDIEMVSDSRRIPTVGVLERILRVLSVERLRQVAAYVYNSLRILRKTLDDGEQYTVEVVYTQPNGQQEQLSWQYKINKGMFRNRMYMKYFDLVPTLLGILTTYVTMEYTANWAAPSEFSTYMMSRVADMNDTRNHTALKSAATARHKRCGHQVKDGMWRLNSRDSWKPIQWRARYFELFSNAQDSGAMQYQMTLIAKAEKNDARSVTPERLAQMPIDFVTGAANPVINSFVHNASGLPNIVSTLATDVEFTGRGIVWANPPRNHDLVMEVMEEIWKAYNRECDPFEGHVVFLLPSDDKWLAMEVYTALGPGGVYAPMVKGRRALPPNRFYMEINGHKTNPLRHAMTRIVLGPIGEELSKAKSDALFYWPVIADDGGDRRDSRGSGGGGGGRRVVYEDDEGFRSQSKRGRR